VFGGFDGEFHNDLHVFHTLPRTDKVHVSESTMTQGFAGLVGDQSQSNIKFLVEGQIIHANKSLVLHRIIEKECVQFADLDKGNSSVSPFITSVAKAEPNATIPLMNISHSSFLAFLKYCYVESLDEKITCDDISSLALLTKELHLTHLHTLFQRRLEAMRDHLRTELTKELISKLVNDEHYSDLRN
jgi:hypothetical protein